MRNQTKRLGELGIVQYFHFPGRMTIYKTITHMESARWTSKTKRWCYNTRTFKAEYIYCDEKVVVTESSKDNEK